MPANAQIHIRGLKELEAAFLELRKEVLSEIKPALLALAEPIREEATSNAIGTISNIGDRWDQFRIGTTVKGVYIAPKYRRRGGSPRKNLAPLLQAAMQDAVDAHEDQVVKGLDELVAASARGTGFTTV